MSRTKKPRGNKRRERYITKLAEDLRKFKEREASGDEITARERRNIRRRELRAIEKMKLESTDLINEANRVLRLLRKKNINTLTVQRTTDELEELGRKTFSVRGAKTYNQIVEEITRASTFLNSPDTNILTGGREERNRALREEYSQLAPSLKDKTYIDNGLIASEEDAKVIFANYRRIESTWQGLIGTNGENGVYGSENLILYMIDVHNRGLDELEYGMKALENFKLENLPQFQELLKERNRVTGISGLFQKGGYYGKLEGLL